MASLNIYIPPKLQYNNIKIYEESVTTYNDIDKTVTPDNITNKVESASTEIKQTLKDLELIVDKFTSGELSSNDLKNEIAKLTNLSTQIIYYKNVQNNLQNK